MKREILFRAKCSGVWRYGSYVYFDKKPIHDCYNAKYRDFIVVNGVYGENHYPITELSSLGQYTGLKDKDGKKIFEGDILEYIGKRKDNMNKVYRRKVVFHEGMFALLSKELPAYSALNYHCMEDGRSAWSVIGNIHDNPELIK